MTLSESVQCALVNSAVGGAILWRIWIVVGQAAERVKARKAQDEEAPFRAAAEREFDSWIPPVVAPHPSEEVATRYIPGEFHAVKPSLAMTEAQAAKEAGMQTFRDVRRRRSLIVPGSVDNDVNPHWVASVYRDRAIEEQQRIVRDLLRLEEM